MTLFNRILIVGKDGSVELAARKFADTIYAADTAADARDLLKAHEPELIFIDPAISLDHACGIATASAGIPVVALVDFVDEIQSNRFLAAGGHEMIPIRDLGRLHAVCKGVKSRSMKAEKRSESSSTAPNPLSSLIGSSKAMAHTRRMIELVAGSSCNPVLIVGETGTGKEIAAKAIHDFRHPDVPFVAVNCAALTANLLESELFGHCKGAFTGADSDKTGLMEIAGCGTMFLDEISEMPLDLQAKLLRVLQERSFRKVGGTQEIVCNATIIASSNRNLLDEVKENRFRRDLYYRLSVCPINIEPLRGETRREDVMPLAEYFLASSTICRDKSKYIKGFTSLAAEALLRHSWPGNVRELKNVIDRAIIIEHGDKISLDSIVLNPDDISRPQASGSAAADIVDFSLQKAEQELIARALRETGWQKSRAASLLGITRATLYAKVKQYSLQPGPGVMAEIND